MSVARTAARTRPNTAGWIAIIAFVFLAGVGTIAALASVALFSSVSANLAPPSKLTEYVLPEETIVYDRTGKIELARFGDAKREVVQFEEIPTILLDATTAIEDKTFWENAGFDPVAIASAAVSSLRGDSRGASTITQQLVRNTLLEQDLVQDPKRTAERKIKEIIESIRLTQAFPGEKGKQHIITAYLNQNYYGNQSYGVKAAVKSYFGIELKDITPAQAAIIAGLPKSPSNYDLVRNAEEICATVVEEDAKCPEPTLEVPEDTIVVERRNQILDLLAEGRTPMSKDQYSARDFTAAKNEPVVLASQVTPRWTAPHFVWAVRDELAQRVCGEDIGCEALNNGGLRVTTTLDVGLQKIAEKWVAAAATVPNTKTVEGSIKAAKALGFDKLEPWMRNLRSKDLHNGALVALDYQTGELVAYVGSRNYYGTSSKKSFQPQYDVVGKGYRQPGSAFKPFNYAVGIDDKALTAGTMLMDVGTDFGGDYTPEDADRLERGPVRVRNALQFSLNIPAVKALGINGTDHVYAKAQEFGMQFKGERTAELALALGVQEVRPVDLVTAYGTLANAGKAIGHTSILTIKDAAGKDVVDPYVPPPGEQVVSPQAAYIVTDILAGNTNRNVNPFWGKFAIRGPDGRRPATLKTGTNNDAKDLNAYGYIAPPTEDGRDQGAYALAVGVWNGNSDNTVVSTARNPLFSIDVSTYVWQGFLNEASAKWPETNFERPADGLVRVKIDPWTGLASSDDKAVDEWFIAGTEPKALGRDACGIDVVVAVNVETSFDGWMRANRDWLRRAERGPGVAGGPDRNRTAYFYGGGFHPYGTSWGALVAGQCGEPSPTPTCFPVPTPDASGVVPSFVAPTPEGSAEAALPCPPESPTATPSEAPSEPPSEPPPSEEPTPEVTPEPPPEPTPEVTPEPTPEPTPEVTPEPPAAAASPAG